MDPAQLIQVEEMCNIIYGSSSNAAQRTEAQNQLLVLQTSADYIPQCQYVLDHSKSPYAQTLACSALESVITEFWTNFTLEQKIDIRNYMLNYLATHAMTLAPFVVVRLTVLVSRITKLGWFDSPLHRQIIEETTKFLEATVHHHMIGLKILKALIEEMNNQTQGKTLTAHRKAAVSFRDTALFNIFQISITTLRQLHLNVIPDLGDSDRFEIANQSLHIAIASLSFDFVGTSCDEGLDDSTILQVPMAWRPIVQETATIDLFFNFYMTSEPRLSCLALQALVQLSSVRRSLFPTERERNDYLVSLINGIQMVMKTKKGLDNEDNYHEFCRLLGRLKANYQLSELARLPDFITWLELSAQFTIHSLVNWYSFSMNSMHYLLSLWGRMVAALPYLRADNADSQHQVEVLRRCVLQIVEAYIQSMLQSVELVAQGDAEDPLEDEGCLKEQLDKLPVIARLQYEPVANFLSAEFEVALKSFEQICSAKLQHQQRITSSQRSQINAVEGRLAWLVYFVGAIVVIPTTETRKSSAELICDGNLCRYVFQLIEMIDFILERSNGDCKCVESLEMAILFFIRSFRKAFFMESVLGNPLSFNSSIVSPLSSPAAHPLLSTALSSSASMSPDASDMGEPKPEITTIYEALGVKDMPTLINMVVNKMCKNIKYWNNSAAILEETLEVFNEMISSYNSSKTLLSLDAVIFLIQNHVGSQFPFLGFEDDNKFRIAFYTTLSRLVYLSAEDQHCSIDEFIAPNIAILHQLNSMPDLSSSQCKIAIVTAFRDWRGIIAASGNRRSYCLIFEALYPVAFELLRKVVDVWFADQIVMISVLKFLQEATVNRSSRITFDLTSANGILLFRETSAIVCSYGGRILGVPVQQDVYLEKYKGIRVMLNTLVGALSGNYVNFGVFGLYNDNALENVLDVSLQLCLQIPFSDVMAFLKLSRAYFSYIEVLFKSHLDVLSGLDASVFLTFVNYCVEGLASNDALVSGACCAAIDHLGTYMFLNLTKPKPTVLAIQAHVSTDPELLNGLVSTLFNTLLFTAQANHWAVTRPILPLLLIAEGAFSAYQAQLIATQSPDKQEMLRTEFEKLVADIPRSVETTNRDRLTQRLTVFRVSVRQFISL